MHSEARARYMILGEDRSVAGAVALDVDRETARSIARDARFSGKVIHVMLLDDHGGPRSECDDDPYDDLFSDLGPAADPLERVA